MNWLRKLDFDDLLLLAAIVCQVLAILLLVGGVVIEAVLLGILALPFIFFSWALSAWHRRRMLREIKDLVDQRPR